MTPRIPTIAHVAAAALIVIVLLLWPSAVADASKNALPYVAALIVTAAIVCFAFRVAPAPPRDYLALGVEVGIAVVGIAGIKMTLNRPAKIAGPRPPTATLGALAEIYDPCERGESAVVCSGVVRTAGYVCQDGYTVGVLRCPGTPCTPISRRSVAPTGSACEARQ